MGRGDRRAGRPSRCARRRPGPEIARVPHPSAARPAARSRRRIPQPVRRPGSGAVRAVRRRSAAPGERDQLRPRAVAHVRPRAIALRHRVRRRFSRHVELAGGAERRVRRDAAGPPGTARRVRAGRIADVAHGRQRRPVGAGEAGHRRRARARPRARDALEQAATRGRRRTCRCGDRRMVRRSRRLHARARRAGHRRFGEARGPAGARARRARSCRRDDRRRAARAHKRALSRARRQRAERVTWRGRTAGWSFFHAGVPALGPRSPSPQSPGPAESVSEGVARRRCESGVRRAEGVEGARGAGKDSVHRELQQLPRRDEQPRGSDSAGPLVPRVVGRQHAGVGCARGGHDGCGSGDEAAVPDARDGGRADRGGGEVEIADRAAVENGGRGREIAAPSPQSPVPAGGSFA